MNPEEEGITHINIYSQGVTELGRLLSNFAYTPFIHPEDGKFDSVEGYWYWLLTEGHFLRDNLRFLSGTDAKFTGRRMTNEYSPNPKDKDFIRKVCIALDCKVEQNPRIKELLIDSKLPFEHYYVYNEKVVESKEHKWILAKWESIRRTLKGEELF